MTGIRTILAAATLGLLAAIPVRPADAGEAATATASLSSESARPGERVTARVTLTPAAETKVYRHSVGIEIPGAGGPVPGQPQLPAGRRKFDEGFGREVQLYERPVSFEVPLQVPAEAPAGELRFTLRVAFQGCTDQLCFPPGHADLEMALRIESSADPAGSAPAGEPEAATEPSPAPAATEGGGWIRRATSGGGLLAVLAAFLAGLLVAFTPCVYPMVPVTVAVIGGAASGPDGVRRKSTLLAYTLVYVLGISLTYAVLGVLAASVGNVMQRIMQSWWLLSIIGLVMALLALSMFGAFDLQLPASITGKLGRFQGAGSLPVLLLSGVVLGLVASPCVSGPIAFLLVSIGSSGNPLFGGASMFAFAWGMSALLIAAGMFPGLLGRPGPWMLWVKGVFGVIMALAGLYFVRTVLPLGLFSLTAVLAAAGPGVALLIVSRRLAETGRARAWTAALGSLTLVVAFYLAYGAAVGSGRLVWLARKTLPVAVAEQLCPREKTDPVGVEWRAYGPRELEAALASGHPAVVDFYADWCTNCDTMEQEVFTDRRVVAEMERFTLLRVDGSTGAPKEAVREAERRFGIAGYPTIIFFGSDGRESRRVVGAVPADDFLAKLREVR